jgi:signal peptide peptidase SppA
LLPQDPKPSSPKLTAVIPVFGILVNRVASLDISETGTGVDALAQQFRQALANPDVRSIVLLFDSPGGSVYGIDEFAQEIFAARDQKRIVAQIDPLAASAAYYLASQASEIAVTPSGEAGSIGVRMMHQDLSKALEAKGIKVTNISAGKYKTEGNPFEPLGEDAQAFMQQRVNDYYDSFVKAVARGRGVKSSEVKNGFGEGRVLGSAEARKLGMVDRVATFDETLARLGASANSARVAMAAAPANDVPNTATAEINTEVVTMETQTPAAAAANVESIRSLAVHEAERIDRLSQLATMHGLTSKLSGWLKNGTSVADAQSEILSSLRPQSVAQPAAEERPRVVVIADEHDKLPVGTRFSRYIRAVAGASQRKITPAQYAKTVLKTT